MTTPPVQPPAQPPVPHAPSAQPAAPAPPVGHGPSCRFCGSVPAVNATIRGHQGMLIVMRFLKLKGPFCRRCGIAAHRKMTSDSLWQGWWGIASLIINPVTMVVNLFNRAKINRLAEPVPGAPGTPADPGKPLFLRPAALGLLLPVAIVGGLFFTLHNDPEYAAVGDCVHNSGSEFFPDVSVVDCDNADADFEIIGRFENTTDTSGCDGFARTQAAYRAEVGHTKYVLCLAARSQDGTASRT